MGLVAAEIGWMLCLVRSRFHVLVAAMGMESSAAFQLRCSRAGL